MFRRQLDIQYKTPEQIEQDARGRAGGGRRAGGDAGRGRARRLHRRPGRDRRGGRSGRPARSRRSRATTATRPRSAPRSTSQVVHAIPSAGQVLHDGDLISIDCGAILDGWHGDAAITVGVGEVTPDADAAGRGGRGLAVGRHRRGGAGRAVRPGPADRHLPRGRGRRSARPAGTASSTATAATASAPRCTRTRTCSTTAGPARGPQLVPGLALAIEPMITLGSPRTVELSDGWTVVTQDGSVAAHVEHTVGALATTASGCSPPPTAAAPAWATSRRASARADASCARSPAARRGRDVCRTSRRARRRSRHARDAPRDRRAAQGGDPGRGSAVA